MSHAMAGAAPHPSNRLRLLLAAILAAVVAPNAAAADRRPPAFVLPELWGVAANGSFRSATFTWLHRAGINTVVIDTRGLRPRQLQRLTRAAGQARLRVVQPTVFPPRTVVDARTVCNAFRSASSRQRLCPLGIVRLLCGDASEVRRRRPRRRPPLRSRSAAYLCTFLNRRPNTRRRSARKALPREVWRSAIQAASSNATLDLAFAPRRARQKTVSGYLKLLDKLGATSPDRTAPTNPTGLTIAQRTQTTLGLSWKASYDKRGVAGYDFYVDGALFGSTPSTAYADSNLHLRYVARPGGRSVRCSRQPLRQEFARRRDQSLCPVALDRRAPAVGARQPAGERSDDVDNLAHVERPQSMT